MDATKTGPAIAQDKNGTWWGCDEVAEFGSLGFNPDMIGPVTRHGRWCYDGCPDGSIVGPFRNHEHATTWLANRLAENAALDLKEAR